MKSTLILISLIVFNACEKEYNCVCTSISKNQDTLIDQVKTTKIGSKGYKKTCIDYELHKSNLKNCIIK